MKKIVFVIESLNLGGAEKSLVTLLNNLDYSRYDVDLIVFHKGGVFEEFIPGKVNLIINEFPKFYFTERIGFKLRRIFNYKGLHSAQILWPLIEARLSPHIQQYDVAIAYSQGFSTYYLEKYIEASSKYAWLNTDYQKAGYKIEFDFPIYKKFDSIVAVSPPAKLSFEIELKRIGKELLINVIKDISDKEVILKKSYEKLKINLDENSVNIVTVARLAKEKSLHLVLESCRKLIKRGYKLHWYIVGEGGERSSLEKLIHQYGLIKFVTLIGLTNNPYPYMRNCDIYVQTSSFEGLGLTVIEASYLNKPIVCTNFPTVFSLLVDNETGLIAEMNSDSIVSKIELLINDTHLRNKLILNLSLVENKDQENSINKIYNLLG